jgi:hypothetical protein
MDPLTVALQALTAFNNFLVTPAGQVFANVNNQIVGDILGKLGVHITPLPAAVKPGAVVAQ